MMAGVARSACPACGYVVDDASALEDPAAVPRPGDVSICLRCASLAVFGEQLELVAPTPVELFALESDPDVVKVQRAVTQFWAARR